MNGKKISVAQFSNARVRAGAEEVILTLLKRLDRSVFDPSLICAPELAALLRKDLPKDVDVLEVYLEQPTQLAAAAKITRYLREKKIDVLNSHQFRASMVASPVAKFAGVPVTIETPHIRELWRKRWPKSSFAIDRFAGRFVDFYIAVSESNAQFLIEKKRLPREKVRVIQNGADLTRFSPAHNPAPGVKKSLGFGESDPVIVLMGRLEAQKGHSVLLDSLPNVVSRFPALRVVFVGDGALRSALEQQAKSLQIEQHVRFVGFQSNAADWFALSDFCVLPSFYEGLPLVAMECLASGRTMIASAVDGTPEVIVDGKTGLLVPPGDPPTLAKAIMKLLEDLELRSRLATQGYQWVMEKFDLNRQIRETQVLYIEALERKKHVAGATRRNETIPAAVHAESPEEQVASHVE